MPIIEIIVDDQFLKLIKIAVMLSQPIPDVVSPATNVSIRSDTTFFLSFSLVSCSFTISMIPWLSSTYRSQMPSQPINTNSSYFLLSTFLTSGLQMINC